MIITGPSTLLSTAIESRGNMPRAKLVIADSPWTYANTGTVDRGFNGTAKKQYDGLSMPQIAEILDNMYDLCEEDAYLFLWITHPLLRQWFLTEQHTGCVFRWRYLTGGSWHKLGGLGVGFHVRGDSEVWCLYGKGKPKPEGRDLSNAWGSARTKHSAKPLDHTIKMIKALTSPQDLILCPFVGLGTDAQAAAITGRAFLGTEIDPERAEIAREAERHGASSLQLPLMYLPEKHA